MSAIKTKMQDLLDMLNEGRVHVKVEMNAEDLKAFSEDLIRRAKDELGSMVEAAKKERMLTKAEVKELFGVCDATLGTGQIKVSSNLSRPATRLCTRNMRYAKPSDNVTSISEHHESEWLLQPSTLSDGSRMWIDRGG